MKASDTVQTWFQKSAILRWLRAWWTERITPGGRFLFLAFGLFFGYGTTSLELQIFVPLLYMIALWSIAFFAMLLERPRAKVNVQHDGRVRAGQILNIEIEVEARGGTTRDWRVKPNVLPKGLELGFMHGAQIPPLKRGQSARVLLPIQANQRGAYDLQGWRVETDFPFGLLVAARTFPGHSSLLVHPTFTPLQRLDLPSGRRYQPGGVASASQRGESLEYIGNRDFREGDDVRHIDWRATARLQTPIVREYREEYFLRAAVVLDTFAEENASSEYFERAISLCASVCDFMAREDYLVDLFAAGPQIYHLTAGRNLAYLEQILDILACVETNSQTPFENLEPEIEEHLAQITTIVCVFLDWTETRRAFVERLALQGAAIKVLLARDTPPTLDCSDSVVEILQVPRTHFENGVGEL